MPNCGIYEIVNLVNGKFYVGSTNVDFSTRFRKHKVELEANRHPNRHLQAAWNKYGPENFDFQVKVEIEGADAILIAEQAILNIVIGSPQCYNICPSVSGSLGHKWTDEAKQRFNEKRKGYKHSPETRKKIGESHLGKKRSEEARRNMIIVQRAIVARKRSNNAE